MATQIISVSSKYKDIISKSSLISSGSPALYQLRPKKEEIGNLTRMTVGERNLNKTNKTILLVGETGTGKSTLINTLVNYSMGVKFEDDIWFQIIEEEKRSQTESQTSDVIVYEIFGFEDQTLPYSLTIIDTPGYLSTTGIEQDDIVSQRLFDLFRSDDGVHEINAVGLVMKASENRLSDRLRYVCDSVMSLFGKDLEKNIVALLTHSNGRKPKNALEALEASKVKCARNEKNQPAHFLFDNCQSEDRTEEREYLEQADKITMEGMSQFTEFLEKSSPQKLGKTVEVLNSRIRLAACINNLQDRIELIELKQTEIKQVQEALKKHEEEMKKNEEEMKKNEEEMKKNEEEMKKNEEEMKAKEEEMKEKEEEMKKNEKEMRKNEEFTVEIDEVYKEKETIRGGMWLLVFYEGAVTCKVCEENCHYPGCTLAWRPEHCEVIKGGRCTSCTRKCPVSAHVKENWIYINKTRRVQKTLTEIKEKYEKNKAEREKKLSLLENLEKEMKEKYEKNKTEIERLCHMKNLEKEMKEKYEENTAESEKKSSLLENLEKEMKDLTAEKIQLLEESYQHVVSLEQIALNVDSVSTHVHLDFLIEKMKEKGDTEKVQKLEEMKRRQDKGSRAALIYSKLKQLLRPVRQTTRLSNYESEIVNQV